MTVLSLNTEWMKTLSGESWIQKLALRNVSKADGALGGREGEARGENPGHGTQPCSQIHSGRQEHPSFPHTLPIPVGTRMHRQTHTPPSLLLRRRPYTHEAMAIFPASSQLMAGEQQDEGTHCAHEGCAQYMTPYSIGPFSQRPLPLDRSLWKPHQRAMTGNPRPPLTGPKPALFREGEGSGGRGQGRRMGREVQGV